MSNEKIYCLTNALKQVYRRGYVFDNGTMYCKECLEYIEVIAAKMRLFIHETEDLIKDSGNIVDVFHIFCPRCDGNTQILGPGGIVLLNDLSNSPLAPTIVTPGVIEYGLIKGNKLKGAKRHLTRTEKINFDFQSQFEIFCDTWKHPERRLPIIKAEEVRLKEEFERKLLAEWMGEKKKTPAKRKGTVTLIVGNISKEIEI